MTNSSARVNAISNFLSPSDSRYFSDLSHLIIYVYFYNGFMYALSCFKSMICFLLKLYTCSTFANVFVCLVCIEHFSSELARNLVQILENWMTLRMNWFEALIMKYFLRELFVFRTFRDMANKYSFVILLIFWLVAAAMSFDSNSPQVTGKGRFKSFSRRVIFDVLLMPLT